MTELTHRFVDFIPDSLEGGVLYIAIELGTACHRCCCGCGREVVTPITPTDWVLMYDGETVSLSPSIGNWNFPCRSHYVIRNNRIEWAGTWSDNQSDAALKRERRQKQKHYQKLRTKDEAQRSEATVLKEDVPPPDKALPKEIPKTARGFLAKLWLHLTGQS